ncbi:MAG TPA: TonB-dependent receptor plug domain-containing protein [Bryobacteraceae bacterium]|nr:TonB-dependent receptor plug domain-containing protein [Bryobacteraceae bacterium]
MDLTGDSLETLMNIEVSSPGREGQRLSHTAAAVYVVTQEDIRRSGLSGIPEVLRMVPGLQVARIDAGSWSITARGFAGQFADKMLVLIDWRSIYNHLNAGVCWEQNTIPLGDIDRIEAIRGPGATMWGANAMNGVINIVTKPARETQGPEIETAGGSAGHGIFYRTYADYFQARLGSRPARAVEISLAGQNLLDGRHLEFAATDYVQTRGPGRAVQLKVTWAF